MSLEAIEIVNKTEAKNKERHTAAELEAKNMMIRAEQSGLELVEKAHAQAVSEGKRLIREGESRAEARCEQIQKSAQSECEALDQLAKMNLSKAVECIVRKVVKR